MLAIRPMRADIVTIGRRIEERADVDLPVVVHSDTVAPIVGTATDIGTMGCRFVGTSTLSLDSHVTVVLRQSTIIGGHVAWVADGSLGIEFSHRLMPKAFARLTVQI